MTAATARLVIPMAKTMVETIEDTARIRRLTEFATDAAHLADHRLDLGLRRLVDDLHRDLSDLHAVGPLAPIVEGYVG